MLKGEGTAEHVLVGGDSLGGTCPALHLDLISCTWQDMPRQEGVGGAAQGGQGGVLMGKGGGGVQIGKKTTKLGVMCALVRAGGRMTEIM